MKAIVARQFGPPASLKLEDWSCAAPGVGEVRVRVHFAGVSFRDVLMVEGKYQDKPAFPFVPCSEFSGEVLEVGSGVQGLAPGDLICGGNTHGILAQEITLPAARVQVLPQGVSLEQAAVLRASYLTAWYALFHCGHLAAGENVLVLGAAGAVGVAACQLAAQFGARVIAGASSPEKRAFALQNGADAAIDTRAVDWRDTLKSLTGDKGLDIVVDSVGGELSVQAFRSLAYKGRHLVVGFASGTIPAIPANLALMKGIALIGVSTTHFGSKEPAAEAAARAQILSLFGAGRIQPQVGRVFMMDDYVAALECAASGELLGRVLLRMG